MNVLVIGGAGFIGCHLAHRHLRRGDRVTVLDDLSRFGSSMNWDWLRTAGGDRVALVKTSICDDSDDLRAAVRGADVVYHMAAQVAVTTSVTDPRHDFMVNALGTFNVLEAARTAGNNPIVFFASTNKVYGGMEGVAVVEQNNRYAYRDFPQGISEEQTLDFHSPYGCSKGAADQYVRDYARIYNLRTVVFRQSCIYGTRQFGVEDQGWIAHFIIACKRGRPVTIYGDGKQVRDILFIDDLCDAYDAARTRIDDAAGKIFNIGGGAENVLSLLELVALLEERTGNRLSPQFGPVRPGDQPVYISDISKARSELGWQPRIGARDGVLRLAAWVDDHAALFDGLFGLQA
ncbi:MAG TPA: GDP-mannose 4,6-dehydratase [bacterium]|nr:GDP-mannose 4,6-dehydratase [bacterium]